MTQGFTTSRSANAPVNTNITSMSGLTGVLQAPTFVDDSSGSHVLGFQSFPPAVNYVDVFNAPATSQPGFFAAGTDTNIIFQINGKGTGGVNIYGTATNDNAPARGVGEFVSSVVASGSPVTLTGVTDITSISLTAGDWDVWGNIQCVTLSLSATVAVWVSILSATAPDASLYANYCNNTTPGATPGGPAPQRRVSLSGTATLYLSAVSGGAGTVCGGIYARRVR